MTREDPWIEIGSRVLARIGDGFGEKAVVEATVTNIRERSGLGSRDRFSTTLSCLQHNGYIIKLKRGDEHQWYPGDVVLDVTE